MKKLKQSKSGSDLYNGSEAFLNERLGVETLLADLSSTFINLSANEIDNGISESLRRIVEFLSVDRATMIQFAPKGEKHSVTHSWAVDGFKPSPEINLKRHYPWTFQQILVGNTINLSKIENLPAEAIVDKQTWTRMGAKSSITIPLHVGGRVVGLLNLGDLHRHRNWPDAFMPRFHLLGEVLANAVARKSADKSLAKAIKEIQLLKEQLESDYTYLREEIKLNHNFDEIIGQSDSIKETLSNVEQIAPTNITVIILGVTGTGKELVARAIHNLSTRKNRPLIKVNCAALSSNLVESELFGHEKGAYTGAHKRRVGRFEIAHGATLFLDEIGELPLETQPKLLRVLQDGEFERLGSARTIRTDARIIAATNRDLTELIRKGLFRKDLFFRLNSFPIFLSPLRKRKEDIPLLFRWFIEKYSKKLGKKIRRLTPTTQNKIQAYSWPGNIRELEQVVERGLILTDGGDLHLDLPSINVVPTEGRKTLADLDRDYIIQILDSVHWKIEGIGGAAVILGLHPSTLRFRMKKLDIEKPIPHSHI